MMETTAFMVDSEMIEFAVDAATMIFMAMTAMMSSKANLEMIAFMVETEPTI